LLAAGLSDVLDGWYARRFKEVTPTGTAIDPVTDKLFVLTVAISLVCGGLLAPLDVLLLSTREIAELPLVVWIATSRHARHWRAAHPSANVAGKCATVFQFFTAAAAIFRVPHLRWLIACAALIGILAAATYWARALREVRRPAAD
jgi:phosphatidylglycerophosphate synthase